MNVPEHYVAEILGEPYHLYGEWWIDVNVDYCGNIRKSSLMFLTKEEAESVKIGYVFMG